MAFLIITRATNASTPDDDVYISSLKIEYFYVSFFLFNSGNCR